MRLVVMLMKIILTIPAKAMFPFRINRSRWISAFAEMTDKILSSVGTLFVPTLRW